MSVTHPTLIPRRRTDDSSDRAFLVDVSDVASIASLVDNIRAATNLILTEAAQLASADKKAPEESELLKRVRLAIAKVETESLQQLADAIEPRRPAANRVKLERRALDMVMKGTEWLSAAEIGSRINPDAANPHAAVSRWLQNGQVFAIDHRGKKMYPSYVFGEAWKPIPEVKKVLSILVGYSPFRLASWFESTNSALHGKRPREVLKRDAKAVIRAAEQHMVGAVHG